MISSSRKIQIKANRCFQICMQKRKLWTMDINQSLTSVQQCITHRILILRVKRAFLEEIKSIFHSFYHLVKKIKNSGHSRGRKKALLFDRSFLVLKQIRFQFIYCNETFWWCCNTPVLPSFCWKHSPFQL